MPYGAHGGQGQGSASNGGRPCAMAVDDVENVPFHLRVNDERGSLVQYKIKKSTWLRKVVDA